MGLFNTFIEYITSSKLEEAKEEIRMLKQQLADKEEKLNTAKEGLEIFQTQYVLIKTKFWNSQAKHSGYLYYRAKYIEANTALIKQTERVKELSNLTESIKPLTKMLDDAMIEIEEFNNSTTRVKKQEEQIKYESNQSIEEQIANDFDTLKQTTIPKSINISEILDPNNPNKVFENNWKKE